MSTSNKFWVASLAIQFEDQVEMWEALALQFGFYLGMVMTTLGFAIIIGFVIPIVAFSYLTRKFGSISPSSVGRIHEILGPRSNRLSGREK